MQVIIKPNHQVEQETRQTTMKQQTLQITPQFQMKQTAQVVVV
jgi:hypothetical protein